MGYLQNKLGTAKGSAGGTAATNQYLDRVFLDNLHQDYNILLFGLSKRIPNNRSKTIEFKKLTKFSAITVPLPEGTIPDGSQATINVTTATLYQYGDYVEITDESDDHNEHIVQSDYTEEQGQQAALSRETVGRNTLVAGTNVYYSSGSARSDVKMPISSQIIRKAKRYFSNNSVKKIIRFKKSPFDKKFSKIHPAFALYVAPDVLVNVEKLSGWKDAADKPMSIDIPGYAGMIHGAMVIENPLLDAGDLGSSWAGSGASVTGTNLVSDGGSNVDVYPSLFVGKDAFAFTRGDMTAVKRIVHGFEHGGPLEQFKTIGWKMKLAITIVDQTSIYRIESGATELN